MRSAARHREPAEEPPPDDAAAVIAELRRIGVETDEIIARMRTIDGGQQLVVESISLAAHHAEMREALEEVAARLPALAATYRMGFGDGRRQAEREAAERAEAEQPRSRAKHRRPRLSLVGGTAAAASIVAVASAGVTIAAQDSASVHPAVAAAASHAAFRQMPPDSASPVVSWSPSARPSAAVKTATPAPSVTPSPSYTPPPPAPAPSAPSSPPAPDLIVPASLHLDGNRGTITLTAGAQAVEWKLDTSQGLSVGLRGGVLTPGQSVQIQVDDPLGASGWLYVSFGGTTIPVEVTSSLAPA